ncbi:hypothetical protein B0H19DRAFT_168033 [Mycena capillaripes]|nr:hypothetical protein B0H19DRAFT_168033 [Mycena capillaripes]
MASYGASGRRLKEREQSRGTRERAWARRALSSLWRGRWALLKGFRTGLVSLPAPIYTVTGGVWNFGGSIFGSISRVLRMSSYLPYLAIALLLAPNRDSSVQTLTSLSLRGSWRLFFLFAYFTEERTGKISSRVDLGAPNLSLECNVSDFSHRKLI